MRKIPSSTAFGRNESLRIGSVTLPARVLLAPMAGITDAPLRRIAARYGAGLVVSEMIAAGWLVRGETEARLRAEGDGVAIHAVQLAGCAAAPLAEAARLAEAAGASLVDLNFGCPAKAVTGGMAGAALLRDVDRATRLIAAVVAAVAVPVTVKMRLGWDETAIVAPELARRAESVGAAAVTVHARTRNQFYQGRADWSAIAAVVAAIGLPVVANGDIGGVRDAIGAVAASNAAAVMIGRAAQGRPWLPGRIAAALAAGEPAHTDPGLAEQHAVLRELFDGLLAHHGRGPGLRIARKHLGWGLEVAAQTVGAAPEHAKAWRRRVLTADTPDETERRLADAFDDLTWRAAA